MEVTGKPTVNPLLFVGGKTAGYFTWIIFVFSLTVYPGLKQDIDPIFDYAAYLFFAIGMIFILFSSFALGRSIRIGLPTRETILKTGGIYKFSRNPMYIGVHLVTLAAMLITLKWWVIVPGIISFYTYHRIILGEEKFLEERFGSEYLKYQQKVRRYL